MNKSHTRHHHGKEFNRLRLLGLKRLSNERRAAPACVLAQIDGLSYRNLRRALMTGKMPFLAHLIKKQEMVAGPWHSMLPTSTSAFQTGLFYGNNDDIPGFFWYDKSRRRMIKMNGAEDTARIEERTRERVAPFPGMLSGGSSYSALFTGGADHTFLTFARLFSPRFNLTTRRGWIWLFLLSQFLLIGRVLYYVTIEFFLAVYDMVLAIFTHKNRAAEFKFFVPRIVSVVICREIATLATILDISRGVGPIYLNYFAYDEHAHLRGPNSRFAFWTLRGIDASIHRIWKAAEKARRNGIRHYDVYVWSDHGQTPSVPFQDIFEDYPQHHFDMLFRALYGPVARPAPPPQRDWFILRRPILRTRGPKRIHVSPGYVEMQARRAEQLSALSPGWLHRLLNPLIRPARDVEKYLEKFFPSDPQRRIALVSTGPFAHLCVDDGGPPLTWEDWSSRYPFFLELIAQHKGIGFTLIRTREGGCRVAYDGRWMDLMDVEEIHRRVPLGLAQILISRCHDLLRLANMPSAGDMLLFGQREPDRPVIAYSYEHGSHGGPSPHETLPFIAVPAGIASRWPEVSMEKTERLLTLRDLHERLLRAYNAHLEYDRDPPLANDSAPTAAPAEVEP